MTNQILKILHESGPQTIDQLEAEIGRDICEEVSALIIRKQVYLEIDGSLWYAGEAAA